jgi:hypothetical protein
VREDVERIGRDPGGGRVLPLLPPLVLRRDGVGRLLQLTHHTAGQPAMDIMVTACQSTFAHTVR